MNAIELQKALGAEKIFCANGACQSEALWVVEGTGFPLCTTCKDAYELGQEEFEEGVVYIDDYEKEIKQ